MGIIGIGGAAGGAYDALQNIMVQRMRQVQLNEEIRRNQADEALRQWQALQWPVLFAHRERVERRRDAEDDAYRAARNLSRYRSARSPCLVDAGHDPPPALGVGGPVGQ